MDHGYWIEPSTVRNLGNTYRSTATIPSQVETSPVPEWELLILIIDRIVWYSRSRNSHLECIAFLIAMRQP